MAKVNSVRVHYAVRLTGEARAAMGEQLSHSYRAGASIRELAARTGRSYGFVHQILLDTGVVLRGRGGAHPPAQHHRHRTGLQIAGAEKTPTATADGRTGSPTPTPPTARNRAGRQTLARPRAARPRKPAPTRLAVA